MFALIFFLAFAYLIFLSYKDIKTSTVENSLLFPLFLFGVGYSLGKGNMLTIGLAMIIIGTLGYALWRKNAIGGADTKLLICLMPFMPFIGIPNMLVSIWFFIMYLLITGMIYAIIWRKIIKSGKEIPFIPIIMISYVLAWIYNF